MYTSVCCALIRYGNCFIADVFIRHKTVYQRGLRIKYFHIISMGIIFLK